MGVIAKYIRKRDVKLASLRFLNRFTSSIEIDNYTSASRDTNSDNLVSLIRA